MPTERTVVLSEWETGEVIELEFVVERILGRGGMGAVYLLRNQFDGQRFAVKRVLLDVAGRGDAYRRSNFLRELVTWIDLPRHPNLTACEFFRTVGDEVVIFSEFADGGSLADAINNAELTGLEERFDVAIQTVLGLAVAHRFGVIHRDVKPHNMLRMADGRTMIGDFGLAKALAVERGEAESEDGTVMASFGGMTPAYASPEQDAFEEVSRKTDQWSWAVSMLDLFLSEVPSCSFGVNAGDVLKERASDLPTGLVSILERCLKTEPSDRFGDMLEVITALKAWYGNAIGSAYLRTLADTPMTATEPVPTHDRRLPNGCRWAEPRVWLTKALKSAGRSASLADQMLMSGQRSRKAQAAADLVGYDATEELYLRLVSGGRTKLKETLARFHMEKAFVHEGSGDVAGALRQYDRCIAIREELVPQEGRTELTDDLANAYMNKALAFMVRGEHRAAVALFDKCIAIREEIVHQEGRMDFAGGLAKVYLNMAIAVMALGENRTAVELYDRCIAIRERLVHQEGKTEFTYDLANAYMNKAVVVMGLGEYRAGVELCEKCIDTFEELVHREGRTELADKLAMAYMNKAIAVSGLGDHRDAADLFDQCIAIREELVYRKGRTELSHDLAKSYMNKGVAVMRLDELDAAIESYEQCIVIYERLIHREGRAELAESLSRAYMNKGIVYKRKNEHRTAVELFDQCIAIRERLVHREGRTEHLGELVQGQLCRAECLVELGQTEEARQIVREAMPILDREIERTQRAKLIELREEAKEDFADLLGESNPPS